MDSKLVRDFLESQAKLANNTIVKPTNKLLVKPELFVVESQTNPESLYNEILEKKPSKKKVLKFIQVCIDSIIDEDD
jgi:hypothetical protein